jgi:signal transduction histidine kinase
LPDALIPPEFPDVLCGSTVEFSTLVQFSKLVSDSSTSEAVFGLLGKTVVEQCRAFHALVFGTDAGGDFRVLSSYGGCDEAQVSALDLEGVGSVAELHAAIIKGCGDHGYGVRVIPLISESALFGALVVLYSESQPLDERQWTLIEGLTELTAISLNKTYQHQKLQKAFDDLKMSQDVLVRTEKLRALGQMSSAIAHDLKNILNPLLLYADHLRDSADDRAEVLDVSNRIERILSRGLETVERLRDFSRQSDEETEAVPAELNSMVHEAVEISKPKLSGIKLVLELGVPSSIHVRTADCVTAIVNLLLNSSDALAGKGTITIRTGSSGGGAWIEVADNGPGIPAEIKNRILEPFFTTKGQIGTGLGLSIVYAFTQRHGGRLDVESEPGQGATFRMWFPAA